MLEGRLSRLSERLREIFKGLIIFKGLTINYYQGAKTTGWREGPLLPRKSSSFFDVPLLKPFLALGAELPSASRRRFLDGFNILA